MEISRKVISIIGMLFIIQNAFSQNRNAFCKAVEHKNFRKVERIVHKVVKKNRSGQRYFNGEGSGFQIHLSPALDSITSWLKNNNCVEDAYWDKCQMKLAIYPGGSSIGVKFITKKGAIEKCFHIQEGTTGRIKIFAWSPRVAKPKTILVYKRMSDCSNFIAEQKLNCESKN